MALRESDLLELDPPEGPYSPTAPAVPPSRPLMNFSVLEPRTPEQMTATVANSSASSAKVSAHPYDFCRCMDVFLALCGLILAMPIFLVSAILIWSTSPGGIIFRHVRIGFAGRSFECLKFRTMEANSEALLPHLMDACATARTDWVERQKIRNDPRVTTVGRFLRRYSIDELPQLINVLRGEMSIVGPRPIVDSEVARYGLAFQAYCSVKPGLTGLWQISGRNDIAYDRRVELDCQYVRTRSIVGDLGIIVRTVPVVLFGRGY